MSGCFTQGLLYLPSDDWLSPLLLEQHNFKCVLCSFKQVVSLCVEAGFLKKEDSLAVKSMSECQNRFYSDQAHLFLGLILFHMFANANSRPSHRFRTFDGAIKMLKRVNQHVSKV